MGIAVLQGYERGILGSCRCGHESYTDGHVPGQLDDFCRGAGIAACASRHGMISKSRPAGSRAVPEAFAQRGEAHMLKAIKRGGRNFIRHNQQIMGLPAILAISSITSFVATAPVGLDG